MNDEHIEDLLRKAPGVKVPAGLAEQLQKQIKVPQPQMGRTERFDARPWLQQWLPAVSVAAFFIACVVVLGVQTNLVSQLKHENANLRAAQTPDSAPADATAKRLQARAQELERLRAANAELLQLRAEVSQLQAQAAANDKLRADNQKLASENAATQARLTAAGTGSAIDEAIQKAKDQAQRNACQNNLKQIGLAARTWEGDHGNHGTLPADFLSMSEQIFNPKILVCPGDTTKTVALDWASFNPNNVSYLMLSPGISETIPNAVYAYCPIHHIYLLVDGSVQNCPTPEFERTHVKVVNGVTMFQ